ncbi:MAG: hypothetical protein HY795_12660 [Desulfovibrio sp.]|nr:hypothetical protein [Desulfovibrio sp.]MBI4960135.1 hypothetical protein [Desulfovibrio sp.]
MFAYGITPPVSDPIADPLKDPVYGEALTYRAELQAVREPQCVGAPNCEVASGAPELSLAFDPGLDG